MGTHPIFESDFDCLTVIRNRNKVKNVWLDKYAECGGGDTRGERKKTTCQETTESGAHLYTSCHRQAKGNGHRARGLRTSVSCRSAYAWLQWHGLYIGLCFIRIETKV